MHNRIHDLVIDLDVPCTCPGPWGTEHQASNRYGPCQGWEYLGKCALRQQP